MRAARIEEYGTPLRVTESPTPEPAAGEVLVRLSHASVNPLDLRVRDGAAGRQALPFVPGLDGVGVVDDAAVAVYGSGLGLTRPGTYAELVCAPEAAVVPLPAGLDHERAAALGLAAVTAWGVVHASADVVAGDNVLVLGASGGVGLLAVQLARAAGARVWAQVARPDDEAVLRELGVDDVVLVDDPAELAGAVRELRPTAVLDALGGGWTGAAVRALAPSGRVVVFGAASAPAGEIDLATLYRKGAVVRGHASLSMPQAIVRDALTRCLELTAQGRLVAHVGKVLPLEEVSQAHDLLTRRAATGKVLLAVGA